MYKGPFNSRFKEFILPNYFVTRRNEALYCIFFDDNRQFDIERQTENTLAQIERSKLDTHVGIKY